MQSLRLIRNGVVGLGPRLWMATLPVGLLLGLGAEWLAGAGQTLPMKAADLSVGWALIACGTAIQLKRAESRIGLLLALTGFAWFLGTVSGSNIRAVATLGTALLFLHLGPLCHAIVCYPDGRPVSWRAVAVVIVGYVYALAGPLARNDLVTILFAALVVVTVVCEYVLSAGPRRYARVTAIAAAIVLAVPLAVGPVLRLTGRMADTELILWAYEAAITLIAVGFLSDILRGRWAEATVARLVIDLGDDAETHTLRGRLSHALGDPSLMLAYWLGGSSEYVDEHGQQLDLDELARGKTVTNVDHAGIRIAALVHDPAAMDAPGLAESVGQAAGIAIENARLQAEVRRQVLELEVSRRRLLEAADTQRRRFQGQLAATAGRRLGRVGDVLSSAAAMAHNSADVHSAAALQAARQHLDEAKAGLYELAAGIYPAVLIERGLDAALTVLVERLPVAVELVTPAQRLPAAIETTIYFVCSEALANAAKHAGATRVIVRIQSTSNHVTVLISDNGAGGADAAAGSGLGGLADRIEALGGRLVIESPKGEGTRLFAEVPAERPERGAQVARLTPG